MPLRRDEKSGKVGGTFPDFHISKYKGNSMNKKKVIFAFKMHRFGIGISSIVIYLNLKERKVNFFFLLEQSKNPEIAGRMASCVLRIKK